MEAPNAEETQLERMGTLATIGEENILPAGEYILASLRQNYVQAQAWLEETASTAANTDGPSLTDQTLRRFGTFARFKR